MHAEVGGVAVPAHHVAGAIPAEAARDDAVRVGDLDQLAVFVITVSHQQAALAVAHLMHAGETAMRFLIREFDIQRFVVAGNPHQPAVFIPAVVLAVLMTIVDAEQPPLTRTRRVRFVDVVLAARHLEHQRAADGVIERDAVFEIIHHVAGGQLAEAQLAARHIAPDKLIVLKAEEAGLKRQEPAGAEHTGRQIAAVVDTLPDERNAIFQREIAVFSARENFRAAGDIHRVLRLARLTAHFACLNQPECRQAHAEIGGKLAAKGFHDLAAEECLQHPFAEVADNRRAKAADGIANKPRPEILTAADIAHHDAFAADAHARVFFNFDFGFAGAAIAVAARGLAIDQHFFRAFRQVVGAGHRMAFGTHHDIARRRLSVRAGTRHDGLREVIPNAAREFFYSVPAAAGDGACSCRQVIQRVQGKLRHFENGNRGAYRKCLRLIAKALLRDGRIEIVVINRARRARGGFFHNAYVVRACLDNRIRRAEPAEEIQHSIDALPHQIAGVLCNTRGEYGRDQYNARNRTQPRAHHRRTRRYGGKTDSPLHRATDDIGEQRAVDERIIYTGS